MTVRELVDALLEESAFLKKGVNAEVEVFAAPGKKESLLSIYHYKKGQTLCIDVGNSED